MFWGQARRLELAALPVAGIVCVALGDRELPIQLFRPDLAPEQMVQLLSPLFAACVVLALRRGDDAQQPLAAVSLVGRRASWLAVVLVQGTAVTVAAWWVLPDDVGDTHVRNVIAYVGLALLLESVSLTAALAAPWVWFAAASLLGQDSVTGTPVADWWAYPIQSPDWHPAAAVALLVLGVAVRLGRR